MSRIDHLATAAAAATSVPVTLAIELNAGYPLQQALAGAIAIGMATAEIFRRSVGGAPPRRREA